MLDTVCQKDFRLKQQGICLHFSNGSYFQIKAEEAKDYKDAVGWEYEALLKKLVDAKQEYLKVS